MTTFIMLCLKQYKVLNGDLFTANNSLCLYYALGGNYQKNIVFV